MMLFGEKKVMSEKNQGFDTGEDGGGNMHSCQVMIKTMLSKNQFKMNSVKLIEVNSGQAI